MQIDEASSRPNRIWLFDERRKAVVRLDYDGKAKKWLLTAYEEGSGRLREDYGHSRKPGCVWQTGSPSSPACGFQFQYAVER